MKEKIIFSNSKGDKLVGILSDPDRDRTQPVVVLCHGFSTSKDGRTYMGLEEILNLKGITTFRFDFYGHGESGGRFEDITTSEAVDDVLNALEYVHNSGFKQIGLFGSSFGGMASILAASRSDLPSLLALKSPVTDYRNMALTQLSDAEAEEWKEKGFIEIEPINDEKRRLNFSFYQDAKKTHAYDAALEISIPTLIVHGEADETVPIEQSRKAADLIPDCRLATIPGCDHVYSNPGHFEQLLKLISGFIVRKIL
jgi:hypothetical protein